MKAFCSDAHEHAEDVGVALNVLTEDLTPEACTLHAGRLSCRSLAGMRAQLARAAEKITRVEQDAARAREDAAKAEGQLELLRQQTGRTGRTRDAARRTFKSLGTLAASAPAQAPGGGDPPCASGSHPAEGAPQQQQEGVGEVTPRDAGASVGSDGAGAAGQLPPHSAPAAAASAEEGGGCKRLKLSHLHSVDGLGLGSGAAAPGSPSSARLRKGGAGVFEAIVEAQGEAAELGVAELQARLRLREAQVDRQRRQMEKLREDKQVCGGAPGQAPV